MIPVCTGRGHWHRADDDGPVPEPSPPHRQSACQSHREFAPSTFRRSVPYMTIGVRPKMFGHIEPHLERAAFRIGDLNKLGTHTKGYLVAYLQIAAIERQAVLGPAGQRDGDARTTERFDEALQERHFRRADKAGDKLLYWMVIELWQAARPLGLMDASLLLFTPLPIMRSAYFYLSCVPHSTNQGHSMGEPG